MYACVFVYMYVSNHVSKYMYVCMYVCMYVGVDSLLSYHKAFGYKDAIPNIMSEIFPLSRYACYPMVFHRAGQGQGSAAYVLRYLCLCVCMYV